MTTKKMTINTFIEERLDLERQASEGPWQHYTSPGTNNHTVLDPHGDTIGVDVEGVWYRPGDAAWIADARTSLLSAMKALARILRLHQPVEIESSNTLCSECSYQLPNGKFFGKVVEYPCPTLLEATDALQNTTPTQPEEKPQGI